MAPKQTRDDEIKKLQARIVELEEKLAELSKTYHVELVMTFDLEAASVEAAEDAASDLHSRLAEFLSKQVEYTVDNIDCSALYVSGD